MIGSFLDSLVNIVAATWRFFQPLAVLDQYEGGVVLRWGRFAREVGPGRTWHWPFLIERVFKTPVVEQTFRPPSQALSTMDDISVVVGGIVRYKITNVRKWMLEVWETRDVFEDVSASAIKSVVTSHKWADLRTADIDKIVTEAVKAEASRFGVRVIKATLADVTRTRALRLIMDKKSDEDYLSWDE
jgi:regulator of protease activity HflC (stomatin/prohibitin superfamily)